LHWQRLIQPIEAIDHRHLIGRERRFLGIERATGDGVHDGEDDQGSGHHGDEQRTKPHEEIASHAPCLLHYYWLVRVAACARDTRLLLNRSAFACG
jgi:hypothetical protein